jgi:hypothetical protein
VPSSKFPTCRPSPRSPPATSPATDQPHSTHPRWLPGPRLPAREPDPTPRGIISVDAAHAVVERPSSSQATFVRSVMATRTMGVSERDASDIRHAADLKALNNSVIHAWSLGTRTVFLRSLDPRYWDSTHIFVGFLPRTSVVRVPLLSQHCFEKSRGARCMFSYYKGAYL